MTGDCCCDRREICETEPVPGAEVNMSSTEAYVSSTKQDGVSSTDLSSTELHVSSAEKTTSSANCTSGCRTDSTGPRHDRCCVFPFIYVGVTHSTCVEVDSNKSWCSTKVDMDGVFIESEWGYCGDNCVFDTPLLTADDQVFSSTEEVGYTSSIPRKPAQAVTEGISEVDTTSPASTTTTLSSTTTTVQQIQAVSSTSTSTASTSSTSTSTALPTTTKTTRGSAWVPYVFVFQAKPSKDFLLNLPPAESVVQIPPTHYDPVRALLGNLV